jgi:aminoglycoside phosphotransferase (APT) family kinase protein
MNHDQIKIDTTLVQRLIAKQFPQWNDLPIQAVLPGGWDNRTFTLGDKMLVRMPSGVEYSLQVEKEHRWLPMLSPHLPFFIPTPLAMGKPDDDYPWKWSIYSYLPGESAASSPITDLCGFAESLAQFLTALQHIDTEDGPVAGPHSFYRGGSLMTYDAETRRAITCLREKIDANTATEIWEIALATAWNKSPVWVHGDVSVGNLLIHNGHLSGVIDFGQLAVGDPACDLAIAWTLFKGHSREAFRKSLVLDPGTWMRGRAWALWKALIVAGGFTNPNNVEAKQSFQTIDEIISDYHNQKDIC